jgi:hypothetical protein
MQLVMEVLPLAGRAPQIQQKVTPNNDSRGAASASVSIQLSQQTYLLQAGGPRDRRDIPFMMHSSLISAHDSLLN